MLKLTSLNRLACYALAVTFLAGCAETEAPAVDTAKAESEHDHHADGDHPETYEEAVKALADIDNTIKNAFAKGDEDAAHGPLHDVGHILEDVNGLAKGADMSDEQRESVKAAVEKLFEAFGAVDETMHGEEGKPYEEVASEIEECLKVLKDACGTESEESQE